MMSRRCLLTLLRRRRLVYLNSFKKLYGAISHIFNLGRLLVLLSAIFLAIGNCQRDNSREGANAKPSAEGNVGQATLSLKNLVIRRRANLLRNTLAKALVLPSQGMCLELGKYPCIDVIHKVDLGTMDAYGNSQYQLPESPSVATPGSFERVILSACTMRANLDFINPSQGVIFKDIKFTIDGRLVDTGAVRESIVTLYHRALTREPTTYEVETLRHMYEDIYKTDPIASGRNWMVLSCFAVLSSTEFAFF